MSTLSVTLANFGGAFNTFNGTSSMTISKTQLVKHAMGVGSPFFAMGLPALHAVILAAFKAMAIRCAVDFSRATLTRPPGYVGMDPSEKRNISFWTGMTFAALAAEQFLGVARLHHSATLPRSAITKLTPSSRRLADFVGEDKNGDWHVLEAKARQYHGAVPPNYSGSPLLQHWKDQARTISNVNGKATKTKSVCLTLVGDPYAVLLNDPDDDPDALYARYEIEISRERLISLYYDPVISWLASPTAEQREREGQLLTVRLVAVDPLDGEFVYFGATDQVLESRRAERVPPIIRPQAFTDGYIGSDGLTILTARAASLP